MQWDQEPLCPLLALCSGSSRGDKARPMLPVCPGMAAPLQGLQSPQATGSQRPRGYLCSYECVVNRRTSQGGQGSYWDPSRQTCCPRSTNTTGRGAQVEPAGPQPQEKP